MLISGLCIFLDQLCQRHKFPPLMCFVFLLLIAVIRLEEPGSRVRIPDSTADYFTLSNPLLACDCLSAKLLHYFLPEWF